MSRPRTSRRAARRISAQVVGSACAVAVLAGCTSFGGGSNPGTAGTGLPTASPRPTDLSYQLRYQGAVHGGTVLDSSGRNNVGTVTTGGGGAVDAEQEAGQAVDQQAGSFLRFPQGSCTKASRCPQALIQTSTPVNPGAGGTATFRFGARVRLRGDPGEAGENVIERGRAVDGQPQWKLQVDHGRASCRWSDGTHVLLLPENGGDMPLEQDRWYDLECQRRPGGVFALVTRDPAVPRSEGEITKTVPEMGAILPGGPVTVGAKRIGGPDAQTDQFRGDLDDIFFHTD
jgi:hypothetical protein